MADREGPFCVASFIGRSDCSTGCMGNHMWGNYMTCSENDFCEMHSSNFTGICCFRKLRLKKKKLRGFTIANISSCCLMSISSRLDLQTICDVKQSGRKRKTLVFNTASHPCKQCPGRGFSMHTPQLVCCYLKRLSYV